MEFGLCSLYNVQSAVRTSQTPVIIACVAIYDSDADRRNHSDATLHRLMTER